MMKQGIISVMVLSMIIASGCSTAEKADMVITGGRVFTADSLIPWAEAVAVRGNMIIAVGSDRQISRLIDQAATKVIDATGKTVIPGFNDAHAHFGPVDPDFIELRYVTDPEVITRKVEEQVSRVLKGGAHLRRPLGA
ncbi:MAG: amidohydrolase family protein [Bacteroidales bacterium]|nr:amidohydrolase family protein [Bacteroidales bacterium]